MSFIRIQCCTGLLGLLVFSQTAWAQTAMLSGTLSSQKQAPLQDALVQVLAANDSSLIKSDFTLENGSFAFTLPRPANYLLLITAPGYATKTQAVQLQDEHQLLNILLDEASVQLSEVEVAAPQKYIEYEKGKILLNVANSMASEGSTAFDVLDKAPGVRIDNNDNISLSGKPGTVIWIDGKPSPLTGQELANYLRSISSSGIDKIEIITSPSAKYDASGSAIINIILKKDKRIGTNAGITSTYLQGVYPKSTTALSLNHRTKKMAAFVTYNFSRRKFFTDLDLHRDFYLKDSVIGAFDQDNYFLYGSMSHVVRAGADYYLNPSSTLGFVVNVQSTQLSRNSDNYTSVYNNATDLASRFRTIANNNNGYGNFTGNINYRHNFDTLGTSINSDLDVAWYPSSSNQNFDTRYYDLSGTEFLRPYKLHGDLKGLLSLLALKNDFQKKVGQWTVELGQKSSYVVADNNLKFYDRSYDTETLDSGKSNHFIYTEAINAAYFSASRTVKKFDFQMGLRVEHTFAKGEQKINAENFERNYAQLFPNALITYHYAKTHQLELRYSRRITRPGYEQLNPFKYYIDATAYKVGYPSLKPSITESFELCHLFNNNILTTLGYGRTFNNIIETLAPLADDPRITVQTNRNIKMVDVFTFNGSVPFSVFSWWQGSANFNVYRAFYYGTLANTNLQGTGNWVMTAGMVNTFKLGQNLSAELSGDYQSRELYAFDAIRPIWSVNLGIQQKVLKNRGTIKLTVSDIFYSNKIRATVNYTGYVETFVVARDTRVGAISFSYNFGKTGIAGVKRRAGGADDIKQRAGNNGVG